MVLDGPLDEAETDERASPARREPASNRSRAPKPARVAGSAKAGRPPKPARAPTDPAILWQFGWALSALAAAAVLLVIIGRASPLALLAMLIMGLPALIGAVWRPQGVEKSVFLGVWGLAAAAATTLEGGVGAPLAVWCVMPAIATIVLEASWLCGIGLSVAALLLAAVIQFLHMASRAPHQPLAFWLSLVAVITTAGGAVGAMAVARHRTRFAKREVQDELDAFQALMGDLPELALVLDATGKPQAVFGRPLEGVDVAALHGGLEAGASEADQPQVAEAVRTAMAAGFASVAFTPAWPAEAPRVLANLQRTSAGGIAAVLRHAPVQPSRPQYVAASAPSSVEPNNRDLIAELSQRAKTAETARARAEADAQGRSVFLANMSHELRTPLNAIMGFSDVMRARMFGDLTPKYAEYVELIHESGRHLMDLINDVLDMSKIEAQRYELSREVFDVRDAVNGSLRILRLSADEAGVRLRAVLPSEALEVDADRRAIKQIVLNLVSNAVKFTPRDGLVTVTAQPVAGALELTVADTGSGIAPEDIARLGKPYEQAGGASDRALGTGLGLSLVSAFARLHGGEMNIESRLGEGTAITVRMPVLVAAAQPQGVEVASTRGEEGVAGREVAHLEQDAAGPLAAPV